MLSLFMAHSIKHSTFTCQRTLLTEMTQNDIFNKDIIKVRCDLGPSLSVQCSVCSLKHCLNTRSRDVFMLLCVHLIW